MILGLLGNPSKKMLSEVISAYVDWLDKREVKYILSAEFMNVGGLAGREMKPPQEVAQLADMVLSFGGDGTLLNSFRLLQGREIPVLGVNLGGLGYLAEVSSDELYERSEDLLEGRYSIEKRIVLEARLENVKGEGPWYALNEVVVEKGGYPRMIHLRTTIDGMFLNDYRADGMIISTPTGSTGYSLSAGGPIVEPKMAGLIVHPLNPHSLTNRPLVISDDKEIRVEAHSPFAHVVIAVDGQAVANAPSGRTLIVRRASFSASLVTFKGRYFYQVLRQKLGWGAFGNSTPENGTEEQS